MISLNLFLKKKGYVRIKLKRTRTNHYEFAAFINDKEGRFILDTGASSSCVDVEFGEFFNLKSVPSPIKAAGAGGRGMDTLVSKNNSLKIGLWSYHKAVLILFNMTHVNSALIDHKAKPINGIIGADILKKGKAVIDYEKGCLYLRSNH